MVKTTKEKMSFIPRIFNIPYSIKNIPNYNLFKYRKLLTYRIEDLIERMRWTVHHDKKKKDGTYTEEDNNKYGFRTPLRAPFSKELKAFEDDLIDLISEVETRYVSNPLQDRMRADLEAIRQLENEVIIQSDKTNNFYIMRVDEYQANRDKELMAGYRKVGSEIIEKIDSDAASLVQRINLDDRIEGIAPQPAFLTIKDHKPDFPNKLSFRVINPAKTNVGKISKEVLDRVNAKLLRLLKTTSQIFQTN